MDWLDFWSMGIYLRKASGGRGGVFIGLGVSGHPLTYCRELLRRPNHRGFFAAELFNLVSL